MPPLTPNTKAILLLTAPLIVGRGTPTADLLTAGDYKSFAQWLKSIGRQPADLLGPDAAAIIDEGQSVIDAGRLRQLLGRGLQLGQAVDRWKQRAIWVVSRADLDYPRRLKARLREQAPAILYGCGDAGALDDGGLAVVGSRHVDDELVRYAMQVGALAAGAGRPIVSGGARGIDQAAMRGALEAGGRACGMLTDSLERQAMAREHRDMLIDGRLLLVSPYDPNAGFNRGHAMQRNKFVYALSDASLVVSSDVDKGGTWAGAIEQLRKLKLVRVYVRSTGTAQPGLDALRRNGAISWPNPDTPEQLRELLDAPADQPAALQLPLDAPPGGGGLADAKDPARTGQTVSLDEAARSAPPASALPDRLLDAVRPIILDCARQPIDEAELAEALAIPKSLAKAWLERLVSDELLEKRSKPARYVVRAGKLF